MIFWHASVIRHHFTYWKKTTERSNLSLLLGRYLCQLWLCEVRNSCLAALTHQCVLNINGLSKTRRWVVVATQLVAWSLPSLKVHSSNPLTSKFDICCQQYWKDDNKEKKSGDGPFKNLSEKIKLSKFSQFRLRKIISGFFFVRIWENWFN